VAAPYVKAAIQALDKDWLTATDDGTAAVRYDAKNRDVGVINAIAQVYAGGSSEEDNLENSVTHVNDPALAASWQAVMEEVDRPEHEIKVDVQFIEVDTQNDLKMGMDYIAWKNGPGRNLFEFIFAGLENVERYRGASSIFNAMTPNKNADWDHSVRFETRRSSALRQLQRVANLRLLRLPEEQGSR